MKPSVLDKVANIPVLHFPFIPIPPEPFSTYPVFHQTSIQTYIEVEGVFLVLWGISVDIDRP